MRAGWLAVVLICLVAIASASTIRLHFSYGLFNNTALINSTGNYSEYTDSLTPPAFVVDGFKLRGEDFILARQDFFRTYTDPETGENFTVFELNALVNSRVDSRTQSLNYLLNQSQTDLQRNVTALEEAKKESFPALSNALQLLLLAGLLISSFFLLIMFLRRYQDKNSPNSTMQWSPADEKRNTYEDEIKEAFDRIERMGGGY